MDYEQRYQAGIEALQSGDAARGLELLADCCAERPDDANARIFLGVAYGMAQRYDDAERSLTTALDLRPDDPRIHYNLARLRERAGDLTAARAGYERALALEPGYAKAESALAALGAVQPAEAPQPFYRYEPAGGASATVALMAAPAGEQGVESMDLVSLIKVSPLVGVGVGLAMAAAYVCVGFLSRQPTAVFQGLAQPVQTALSALVGAAIMAALYNALAPRVGPVLVALEPQGPAVLVRSVQPLSLAKVYTVATGIVTAVIMAILVPIALLVYGLLGLAAGERVGMATPVAMVVVLLVLVVTFVLALAMIFVGTLIAALLYNAVVGLTGGARLYVEQVDGQHEVTGADFWPTAMTMFLVWLPTALLMVSLFALGWSGVEPDQKPALIAISCVMPIAPFLRVALYNLAARWVGGVRLRLGCMADSGT